MCVCVQGTTLRRYFEKVAAHHGLDFKAEEYSMAEDPSSHDDATLYVTHLREPVSRSISHFKCKDCLVLLLLIGYSSSPVRDISHFSTYRHSHFVDTQMKADGIATT